MKKSEIYEQKLLDALRVAGRVDLADAEQLTALPGIGEVLAGRIVAYREENGSFLSTQELQNVEGIGEKRLDAILDLITVGG